MQIIPSPRAALPLALLSFVSLLAPAAPARADKADKSVSLTATRLKGAKAAEVVTAAQLRDYLTFIASDELEGRDTPSRGLDIAAKYLASHLARWGLKPMGDDGTFFQKITLVRESPDADRTVATVAGMALKYGTDFTGSIATEGAASGPLVYVGHGWVYKSKGIDAYKGLDVKGKILVVSGARVPEGVSFRDLQQGEGSDWLSPAQYAAKNGAVGILRLPSDSQFGRAEQERLYVERLREGREGRQPTPLVPTITLTSSAAEALLAGEKVTAADAAKDAGKTVEPFALSGGKEASFTVAVRKEKLPTQNVVAAWEGSDPKLKAEYVAIGAHYDHVGVRTRPGADGDRIYNGADDDGSGTVALLSMAEALAKAPKGDRPKRSVLFVWHTGEEKGLWGSDYFTRFPTVPLTSIVTQLNIDMIGRSKAATDGNPRNANLSAPDEIYVIGSKRMSTKLAEVSEAVNRGYPAVRFNYRYDEPNDPNRFYERSDHYNYAKRGVPIIFYFDGVHEDYHQVGDEVEKIDFAKMEKVTRTVLLTAIAVADLPQRPPIDKKPE